MVAIATSWLLLIIGILSGRTSHATRTSERRGPTRRMLHQAPDGGVPEGAPQLAPWHSSARSRSSAYALPGYGPPPGGSGGYGGPQYPGEGGGYYAPVVPDVASFAAISGRWVTADAETGRAFQLQDSVTATAPDGVHSVLTFHGNCMYEPPGPPLAGGGAPAIGSVRFDGASCHAVIEQRSCSWEKAQTLSGYTLLMLVRTDAPSEPNTTLAALATQEISLHYGNADLVWRARAFARVPVPLVDDGSDGGGSSIPDNSYDDEVWSDSTLSVSYEPPPPGAWTLEAVAVQYGPSDDPTGDSVTVYRGALSGAPVRQLARSNISDMQPPSGFNAALGCDLRASLGGSCAAGTFFRGGLALFAVYGRALTLEEVAWVQRDLMDSIMEAAQGQWQQPQPPAAPPAVPSPPPPGDRGLGLSPDLRPDIAYFDALSPSVYNQFTVDSGTGRVLAWRDLNFPGAQQLQWRGNCTLDDVAGGSVLLDGATCHAILDTQVCSSWEQMAMYGAFSVALVLQLTEEGYDVPPAGGWVAPPPAMPPGAPGAAAPPPRPPPPDLGPYTVKDTVVATWSRPSSSEYYYFKGGVLWGDSMMYKRSVTDDNDDRYDYVNDALVPPTDSFELDMPARRWTVEVITSGSNAAAYFRGAQRPGAPARVVTSQDWAVPAPDGSLLVMGCDYLTMGEECVGYKMKGRLAALLVYSRTITQQEVTAINEYYARRWWQAPAAAPPPAPADWSPPAAPQPPPW